MRSCHRCGSHAKSALTGTLRRLTQLVECVTIFGNLCTKHELSQSATRLKRKRNRYVSYKDSSEDSKIYNKKMLYFDERTESSGQGRTAHIKPEGVGR
jgi:hypothetical protein